MVMPHGERAGARRRRRRHAGRRGPRRGTLQDIADVVGVVLDGAGEVGVAGARERDGPAPSDEWKTTSLLPVDPVTLATLKASGASVRPKRMPAVHSTWSRSMRIRGRSQPAVLAPGEVRSTSLV
jgi:hypothetical protein